MVTPEPPPVASMIAYDHPVHLGQHHGADREVTAPQLEHDGRRRDGHQPTDDRGEYDREEQRHMEHVGE